MRLGLYVHIPFCRHKCLYCDFLSYAGLERYRQGYVEALCRDIAASPYAGEEADTVYIGGGTPSMLEAGDVSRILKTLRQTFRLAGDAEITMEANPDSLDYEKAAALSDCGVNRLSLGVQSFSDAMLAFLGRVHTAAQGEGAIQAAYAAGIHNLSLDLMYGLPGQSLADVRRDVERLSQLPVVHASIYSLIVEDGTQLKAGLEKGMWHLPPDGTVDAMAKAVHDAMHGYGFHHYEISSYAKGPFESRHNSKYWTYEPYIGFGVSPIPSMARRAGPMWPTSRRISVRPAGRVSSLNPSPSTPNGPSKITASWPCAAGSALITAIMPGALGNPSKPTSVLLSTASSTRAFWSAPGGAAASVKTV